MGRVLQQEHSEIITLYREGNSHREIVKLLYIQLNYNVTYKIACSAVNKAIRGNSGIFGERYNGLIPDAEAIKIAKDHKINAGKDLCKNRQGVHALSSEQLKEIGHKGGSTSYTKGKGIHALSKEDKRDAGLKGGQRAFELGKGVHSLTKNQLREIGHSSGNKTYEEGIGIHALSSKQRRENSLKGLLANGKIPWSSEEVGYAYQLSISPEYRNGLRISGKDIAVELNSKFHKGDEIRNNRSVSKRIRKYIKSLEDQTE